VGEVTVHSALDEVVSEWDELAARTGATPFARPMWLRPFWRHFGSGTLELVALRRGRKLVALAPLARHGGVLASLANYHTPQYAFVAESDEARAELVDAVLQRCRRLDLRYVDRDGADFVAVRDAARARGWLYFDAIALRSPYVPVEGSFDDYLNARDSSRRKDMRRHRRRLTEEAPLELEVCTNEDDLDVVLGDAFRLEESGWKAAAGTSIISEPQTKAFYTELCAEVAKSDALRVCFLRVGAKRVATEIGFELDGSHYSLKSGYDPGYRTRGVGVLLQEEVLRWDWDAGAKTYEFLGDVEPHKMEWASESDIRVRAQLKCFSRAPRSLVEFAGWRYGRPLAKRARELRRR
jgi:CelD/BcsL family acetyltransferase involved in cellulose biosynthesis